MFWTRILWQVGIVTDDMTVTGKLDCVGIQSVYCTIITNHVKILQTDDLII